MLLPPPLKNEPKKDTRGPDRVENQREIVPGTELAERQQRALERAIAYPNSNRQLIVSGVSLVR